MVKIFAQFGWSRNLKGGQLVNIYLNNNLLTMTGGDYITGVSERHKRMWYMKPLECNNGDIIILDCKVGIRTLGEDSNNTFSAIFQVDDSVPETEFGWASVGYGREFKLLKGKFSRLALTTAKELKELSLKAKMKE